MRKQLLVIERSGDKMRVNGTGGDVRITTGFKVRGGPDACLDRIAVLILTPEQQVELALELISGTPVAYIKEPTKIIERLNKINAILHNV
jgi:hypothetical protein